MEDSKEILGQITGCKKKYFLHKVQTKYYLIVICVAWLILCLPQNIYTLFLYFNPEAQGYELEPIGNYSQNYSCFKEYRALKDQLEFGIRGIFVSVVGSLGMISNTFSIMVLQRLAAKSGFNRLLLSLGKYK